MDIVNSYSTKEKNIEESKNFPASKNKLSLTINIPNMSISVSINSNIKYIIDK